MRIASHPVFLSLAVAGLFCATGEVRATDVAEASARWKSYSSAGDALLLLVNTKKVDVETVDQKAAVMVADATWVANEYLKLKPEASKWFKAVFDNLPSIRKMPYEEIEKNWHDGRYFEGKEKEIGIDPQDEKNEHFRDPLDAVTHVILVQRSAQDYVSKKEPEALRRMKADLVEGLDQMRKAVAVISKK